MVQPYSNQVSYQAKASAEPHKYHTQSVGIDARMMGLYPLTLKYPAGQPYTLSRMESASEAI
jgi:hypothetical protein